MGRSRIVVVGAGVSGLAAAHRLAKSAAAAGRDLDVIVLERGAQVGGKARTLHEGGFRIETGPTSYLDNSEPFRELVSSAGLDDVRIQADAAAKKRYLVRGGVLRLVQAHPLKFATSGLLGPLGVARIAAEPFLPRISEEAAQDETVWQFARRRLGAQAADRLIAPMVLGVHAGDAKKLSLQAAFPRLAALEREHGSLIRGALARKRAGQGGGPTGPSGAVSSFVEGLGALPEALAATPGVVVRCGATVTGVDKTPEGWRVVVDGDSEAIPSDAVILAGEGYAMGRLLSPVDADGGAALAGIPTPPVTVVALGFTAEQARSLPLGFGALVQRGGGLRLLGTLWDSQVFVGRSPEDHVLIRAMYGGSVDPEAGRLDDQEVLALARRELAMLVGIEAPPVHVRVVRWDKAIPQYEVGHQARVAAVESACARNPGLYVAGNALYGVAFSKAAEAGLHAADAAWQHVSATS